MFSKAIVAAAALAASAVPAMAGGSPKLNLYWGQGGGSNPEFDIDYYCKTSKPDMISMAFMNVSPEHAGGKYGGTNFANHCSLKYYTDGGVDTKLLDCTEMIAGVHNCQKNYGVKILLSIGGVYSDQNNYSISSGQKGEEWAKWLWQAYGPKPDNYDGPRPLDSDTEEFIIDGFDFDLEFPAKMTSAEGSYWAAMVAKLRSLASDCGRSVYLTAAPQCPLSSTWFFMDTLLAKAAFDALFIQFYNNPACDGIPNNTPGDSFGYKAWEAYAAAGVQKDAKLFIGLPAADDISGYLDRNSLKQVICEVLDDATCTNFGGISLWDAGRAWANVADGKNYMEYAQYLLNGGCHPTTTTSTTTTSSSTTSVADTTTSADTTTTSAADTTTTTCDTTSTSETASSEATSEATTSSAATSESTTGTSDSTSADATSTSTSASTTGTSSNTSTADYPEPTGDDDDDDECDDDDDDDDDDGDDGEHTHTHTHTHTGTATQTGGHHHTTKAPYTTSTVYTTTVYTVTSCPPEKGGCHPGAVTTEVIALTTTVCPVTEASPTPTGHGCTGENCGGSGSGHSGSGGSGNSGSGHSGSGGSGNSGSGHSGSGGSGSSGSGSSGSSGSSGGSGCTGAGCGSSESSTFMTKAAPATSAPSSGLPKPTGSSSGSSSGCTGAGCPSTTIPVTAGSGNVAFSVVAVLAAAIFAL